MITFETQEAFSKAVMKVLEDRLVVAVKVSKCNNFYDADDSQTKVEVTLCNLEGQEISSDSDYE